MTSSNRNIFCVTGHLRGEFTGPWWIPCKGQRRGAMVFSWVCVWINGWVNNREAGDRRRYRAHYDVTVMFSPPPTNTIYASPRISSCSLYQTMKNCRPHKWLLSRKKTTLNADLLLWLIFVIFPTIIICIYSAVKQLFVCASGAVSRGGYLVGFRIGMLSTARRLETLRGSKKGGRNYTFCPIFMKNRGRNTTFSSFLLKYRGRNYTNFPETWKRGSKWRSICSNLHIVSAPPRVLCMRWPICALRLASISRPTDTKPVQPTRAQPSVTFEAIDGRC